MYKNIVRKALFINEPESIHNFMSDFGETLGKTKSIANILKSAIRIDDPILKNSLLGMKFQNPVGLAAGFDYEAKLTQILPSIGFGFATIGTITNFPYGGNSKPKLGRLPKSKLAIFFILFRFNRDGEFAEGVG